jgi:hypothetical protein
VPNTLREAKPEDVPALAALHVRAFDETHCSGLPEGPTYELRQSQWRQAFATADGSWFCLVIEDEQGGSWPREGNPHDGGVPGFTELNKIYCLCRVSARVSADSCSVQSRIASSPRVSPRCCSLVTQRSRPTVSTRRLARSGYTALRGNSTAVLAVVTFAPWLRLALIEPASECSSSVA